MSGGFDDGEITLAADDGVSPGGREPDALTRGRLVGRYVVLDKIGAGGMGAVFRAYDPELDRVVALKVLHPDRETQGSGRGRLVREAQAMARLSHPNVIVVHDVGTHEDRVFIAMEYVEGRTLRGWLEESQRGWKEIVEMFLLAGEGLAAAHQAQLVHRDFKPDNVLVSRQGRVRVLDFGLVHFEGAAGGATVSATDFAQASETRLAVTQTGKVIGTPAYMSPEQLAGEAITAHSDQFSFCVAFHEALYGVRPFVSSELSGLLAMIACDEVPEAPPGSTVPGWVRRIVLRGLQKSPQARFEDMKTLLDALRRDPARTRSKLVLGVGGAALAVGAGVLTASFSERADAPCAGAREHTDELWNETTRRSLHDAFVATGRGYAQAAAQKATEALDAYTDEWVATHESTCLAAAHGESSQQLLDLQMSCLDDRLQSVRGVVELFGQADEQIVEHSARVVDGLPALTRCTDTVALQAELAPPEDPADAAEFERIRKQLADNRALRAAGKIKRSATEIEPVLAAARALNYAPLLAEVLLVAGEAVEGMEEFDRASELLEEAYYLALEAKRDHVAADAAGMLAIVRGIRLRDLEGAAPWGRGALSLARRVDPGGSLESKVLTGLAERQRLAGNLADAEAHAQRAHALALAEGERSLRTAETAQHLSRVVDIRGRSDEALELAQLSLEIRREQLGPRHPTVAVGLAGVSHVLGTLGRDEEALESMQRSLEISAAAYGRRSRSVGSALVNMCNYARGLGRIDDARRHCEEALEIYVAVFGDDHPKTAGAHMALGLVFDDAEQFDDAISHYERAIAIREQHHPDRNMGLAGALYNLAGIDRRQGRLATALERNTRSLSICEAVLGAAHPQTTQIRIDTGDLLNQMERADEAVVMLRQALAERTDNPVGDGETVWAQFILARALWTTGETAEATQLATDAQRALSNGAELDGERTAVLQNWVEEQALGRPPR